MASTSSSSAATSSSGYSHELPPTAPEKRKFLCNPEQRVYELIIKARRNGLFTKIPPCHKRARNFGEELIKVAEYEKLAVVKGGPAELGPTLQAIQDLSLVKLDKMANRPGYDLVMTVLKEEFQNYTTLAHQRGLEEKGEIFQFISHFPMLGVILKSVNAASKFRYDGIMDEQPRCTHNARNERIRARLGEQYVKKRLFGVTRCNQCDTRVIQKGNEKLELMNRKLDEFSPDTPAIDAAYSPEPFEKTFKISKDLLEGANNEYSKNQDALRKIWGLDIVSVDHRDKLFRLRIRQQRVAAMTNLYDDQESLEEHHTISQEIEKVISEIRATDKLTKEELQNLKDAFVGPWDKVRRCLGTTTTISSEERKIRRLQDRLQESEKANEKLKRLYEAEKAKNRSDDKDKPGTSKSGEKPHGNSKSERNKEESPKKKKKLL